MDIDDRSFLEGSDDLSDPRVGNTQTEAVFQDDRILHDQPDDHQRQREDHHGESYDQLTDPVA